MKNKENALSDFLDMIIKSWTWDRMTDAERCRAHDALIDSKLFGTYRQRWDILNAVYYGFLLGIEYKPIGWRETEEVPQF